MMVNELLTHQPRVSEWWFVVINGFNGGIKHELMMSLTVSGRAVFIGQPSNDIKTVDKLPAP